MNPSTSNIEKAFIEVQQNLRSYLRRRLPDPSVADDLVQDVFIKALSAQADQPIKNIIGWLYTATRTTLVDYFRTAKIPMEQLDNDLSENEPENTRMHEELSSCIKPFINELPALYRDTLIAVELEGKTMRSVAETQNISLSAIKSRVARGKAMLKDLFSRCCSIQFKDGLVDDYYKIKGSSCGKKCT